MRVDSEDIPVAWGQVPHPLDSQYEKWRMAACQDAPESFDGTKLYFLYDPQADEQSGTSGQFALKCPSPQGGSAFMLVAEEKVFGQIRLNVSRISLDQDGLSIANVRPLIQQALTIGSECICSMREDQARDPDQTAPPTSIKSEEDVLIIASLTVWFQRTSQGT